MTNKIKNNNFIKILFTAIIWFILNLLILFFVQIKSSCGGMTANGSLWDGMCITGPLLGKDIGSFLFEILSLIIIPISSITLFILFYLSKKKVFLVLSIISLIISLLFYFFARFYYYITLLMYSF